MAYPFDDTYPPEFGAGIVQQNLPWADRDWMGTGDPFTPMQPRMGPAPQFDVPTPNFYAPPVQEQVPDDFFTRLARSQGPTPFQFQPRQGNNARGIDVILAALQGFANARTAGATRGAMDVEQRNKQRSEGARLMAEERWRQAKFRQDTLQNRQRIAASQALEAGRDKRLAETIAGQDRRTAEQIAAGDRRLAETLKAQAERDKNKGDNRPARRLTAAENEALADYTTILQQINDVKSTYRPSLVGPVPGFIGGVKQKAGWRMEPGESEMRSALAGVRNTILKMKSGGAVTPDEAKRLLEELATVSNAGPDFEAKLGQFERTLRTKAQTHRDILSVDADLSKYPALPATVDYKYRSGASTGGGAGVQPTGSPGQLVRMKAPDGRTLAVPPEKVAELKAKGAVEF